MSKNESALASARGVVLVLGIAVLVLGIWGLFSTAWSGSGPVEEIERSFSLPEGRRIEVRGRNGAIEYVSWEGDEVVIRAIKRVSGLSGWLAERMAKAVRVEIAQDGEGVRAIHGGLPSVFFGNVSVNFAVLTPKGWSGEIHLATSNGRITARDVRGDADLRTANGAIVVEGQSGSLRARTSNGAVQLADINGAVDVESSNGPIRLEGGSLSGPGRIRTSNGAINIRGRLMPGASFEARTSNGPVTVALVEPDLTLDLETSNGAIDLDVDVVVSELGRRSLRGRIGDGAATLVVRTSNGSIRLSEVESQ